MSERRGLPARVKMRHDTHFVEELASRHSDPVGQMVPLAAIETDPRQPRAALGNLDELAKSIRERGVLEPILIRPRPGSRPDSDVRYRIISGERRYTAAAEAGLYEIPAIEMDVSEEEALEIALVENLQRKDLTPFEEAEGYRALKERYDYTHDRIAGAVGRSRTVVTESLKLLRMPRRAREAAQALNIQSGSVLLEIMRASSDEDEMIALLEKVSDHRLTRDDLRVEARRRAAARRASRGRRKPHTFKFRSPDRSYSLSLSFRKSEVDRSDLISALERVLDELRAAES